MEICKFNNEIEELVIFFSTNSWPFHVNNTVEADYIRTIVESNYYTDGRETLWIIEDYQKVGIIVIDDIEDSICTIDIRLIEASRGKGLGVQALKWLQNYLFGELKKIRMEGYTRADNNAMRKCFTKANFVKEGYLRSSWENKDRTLSDTILYAAIIADWKNNRITPIKIGEGNY